MMYWIKSLRRMSLLMIFVSLWPVSSRAQLSPDWSVSTANAQGAMVALDAGHNAYVVGTLGGPAILVTRVSPAGAQSWQRSFSSPGVLTRGTGIAADAAGNTVVVGSLVSSGGQRAGMVVLKYDAQGALQWQDVTASNQGTAVRALIDADGNAYVLGLIASASGTGLELAVVKYGADGVRQWARSLATGMTGADAMAFTPGGDVVVSGRTSNQIVLAAVNAAGNPLALKTFPAASESSDLAVGADGSVYVVGGASTGGFLVVKHSAAFTELWRNIYTARGPAMRAALDSTGNLVVTGATDTNTGPLTVVLYDWLTIKVDPNGTLLWSRTYGENGAETPYAMATGSDGAIYISGEGRAPVFDPSGTYFLSSTLTVKYGADGVQNWASNVPAASVQVPAFHRGVALVTGKDGGALVVNLLPQTLHRYPQSGLANQHPIALASASPASGLAPLSTAFSSAGSVDPDGLIASYLWDFGDGQTSDAANPVHSYSAGIYTARLTVTDTLGASATSTPLTITSTALPPVVPTSLTLAKSAVSGGKSVQATVKVSRNAGVTLTLTSSNPSVAGVPATVVLPAGATSAIFTIKTSRVRRSTSVTISATANGTTARATLTVRP